MRTTVGISFRASASDIRSMLPKTLTVIKKTLNDPGYFLDKEYSRAIVYADEALTEEIIAWGQQEHKGKTLIGAITIKDHYEIADLQHFDLVEVFAADPKEREPASLKNAFQCYETFWQCSLCNRTSSVQVEDMEVKLWPNLDVQLTDTYEWIFSKRLLEVLEQAHVSHRPLKKNQNYVQLVLPESVTIEDQWPVVRFGLCPECNRFMAVLRSTGTADGLIDFNSTGLEIRRDIPLSIRLPSSGKVSFAQSDKEFGRFEPYPNQSPHRVGERFDLGDSAPIPWTYFFADARLVERLLESGATGIGFRPANIVS